MCRQNIRILVYFTFVVLAAAVSGICLPNVGRLVSAASTRAQEPLWQEIASGSLDALKIDQQSQLSPERYRALQLNEAALANVLADAPMEFTEAAKDPQNEITLPMPDGAFARFRFVESPIMAPELAAQFPEIKTYQGWGIDDPTATTRFDRTSGGFHAIVLSPGGAFYIAPLSRGNTRTYASYLTRDAGGDEGVGCGVGLDNRTITRSDHDTLPKSEHRAAISASAVNASALRTFRLAVGATGEYTGAFGGTVAGAMNNGIVPTVNNVIAIYRSEMSVSVTLVGNASSVFTNPNTDPYTSGNVNQLVTENQQTLDQLIGESNYDIGHVFDGNSGGGLAAVGAVCDDGREGRGASSALVVGPGTAFDLLVAHEFGHQFGANHTFNGTAAGCGSPGQLNNDTAYEPGSGSTIMSYAGICGSDDIQTFTSPYFHWQSLAAMAEYLDNNGGCATTTNNNNTPPTVTPPFPSAGHYFIPSGTPFALTASATDAEDRNLTYCWEEADNGSPGPPTGDRGDNPLFRSSTPTSSPSRTFPQMADVLSGNPTLGEALPTTDRWLTFVVTARDNHSPGGGFNQGAVRVNVCWHSMPFAVTAPTAGTQALEGSSLTVTWDLAFTNVRPINTSDVRILLSTDDGATFPVTLVASTTNDGSHTFTVPRANTQEARIKVEAIGNIFFNVSPAFTIIPKPTIAATGILTVTRGGPLVTSPVATVADGRDTAGSLGVVITTSLPTGVTLDPPTNTGGVVRVTATAQCNAIATTRSITLEVTNSAGLTARTTFNLVVDPNPPPILGDYGNATVIAGQWISVSPSAPPSDPNGNLVSVTPSIVVPTPVPGSATLWAVDGVVNVSTSRTMRLGVHQIQVEARDSCFDRVTKDFFLTVVNSPPQITSVGNSVRTTQGGLPAPPSIRVATVSDQQDAPGALLVSAIAPAAGLTVSLTNSNGTIMATATAICAVAPGAYTATVRVTDSAAATASATFPVIVDPNLPPTLGSYLNSGVTVGGAVVIVPNAPPSDPNNNANNAVTLTINPVILPGGGQVTVNPSNGHVTVNTVANTTLGTYGVIVTARDACGAPVTRTFRLTVRSATCITERSSVFVADTGNHRIQRFSGVTWNIIGAGIQGSGLGQFSSPESVVASPDGQRIYVADTGNSRIQWSQDFGGTWTVFAGNLVPRGLVLDRDGNLYVSDARDNRVLRYAGGIPGASILLATSGSGAGRVSNPNGLAIDCRMNLYIADTGNNRILVIATADSAVLPNTGTVVAGSGAGVNPAQVTAPQGVAVDNAGRLYVADTGNNRVLALGTAPLPGPAVALCTFGAALGQVSGPEGLTIAALTAGPLAGVSSIIVSDTTNNRIQARSLPAGSWMLPPPPVGNGPGAGTGQFKLPSKIR